MLGWLCFGAACDDTPRPASDAGVAHYDGPTERVSLIDNNSWKAYPASQDPLRSHQPKAIDCGVGAFYVENGSIEFDTGRCNYQLATTPALASVPVGTPLEMFIGHFDLNAPMPAETHVAILFDKDVEWETTVPVPHDAQVFQLKWRSRHALARGKPIRVHLHNHGQNMWLLVSLDAMLPIADAGVGVADAATAK